jgi:release factor glutamine methyltransferase
MTKINLQLWLDESQRKLQGISDFPVIETLALAVFILDKPKEWILTHGSIELSNPQLNHLDEKLKRLNKGEPLPYLVGHQAFYGLDFKVTPDVLIPRPETELLVEEAITWLSVNSTRRRMLDVGTGSGIIPITLADHFSDLSCLAVDISSKALSVAAENIRRFNLEERISLRKNDLLESIDEKFDLITANLPYIPTERLKSLTVSRFEPGLALDGGSEGIDLILRLLKQAPANLIPCGLILLEVDSDHSNQVFHEATKFFPSAKISILS